MKLYHFMGPEHALENLSNGVLHVSQFKDLNDPYEAMPFVQEGPGNYAKAEEIRKKVSEMLSESAGLICLTTNATLPTMWSYYAKSHKGIALEFSFVHKPESSGYIPVRYPEDSCRVQLPSNFEALPEEDKSSFYFKLLSTKSSDWQHEAEYRRLVRLENCDTRVNHAGELFIPFVKELSGVILGVDCSLSNMAIRKALYSSGHGDLPVFKATMDDKKYCVKIPANPVHG